MVCNTLPPFDLSGAGEQVVQLAQGLRARGIAVELIGRGGAGARGPKFLFPATVVWPALRALRRQPFAVLQVHESDGGLLLIAAALLRAVQRVLRRDLGIPPLLVVLQQVTYREEFLAVRALYDRSTGRRLARPVRSELVFRWLRAPLHFVLGVVSARLADRVLVPSLQTGEEVRRDYGARHTSRVANTKASRASAEPAPAAEPGAAQRPFLFVGRLRIRKGVEILLDALRLVPEAQLQIVGDGEREEVIRRLVADWKLADRVHLLGRRGGNEIEDLLTASLALVVPSTYEGMPLVVLEAMDRSRAVIASRVSGIPEVVVPGQTGWLVDPEEPSQLAQALAEALQDPAEADRRGAQGRTRLDEEFRPGSAVESWLAAMAERN
jgi:glycosyltransferase involved in cell wall biosynthesis